MKMTKFQTCNVVAQLTGKNSFTIFLYLNLLSRVIQLRLHLLAKFCLLEIEFLKIRLLHFNLCFRTTNFGASFECKCLYFIYHLQLYSIYYKGELNVKAASNQCDVTLIKTDNVLILILCKNLKKIKVNFINSCL